MKKRLNFLKISKKSNFKNSLLTLITLGIYNKKNNIQKEIDKLNLEILKYESEKNTHQTDLNILKASTEQKITKILETQITILKSLESNLIQAQEESEQLNTSMQENNVHHDSNSITAPSTSQETSAALPEKDDKEFDKNSSNDELSNNPLKSRSSSQQSLLN